MGCGVYYQQINELERALGSLRRAGLGPGVPAYNELNALRGKLLKQVGLKYPRTISLLFKLAGLSPGEVKLWHDVEAGWMTEARAQPGAPPVYKYVPDQVAVTILKGELTHELEEELMTPESYFGE